jgi:hypothetical protein
MVACRLTRKPIGARAPLGLLLGSAFIFSACHDLEQHVPPGASGGSAALSGGMSSDSGASGTVGGLGGDVGGLGGDVGGLGGDEQNNGAGTNGNSDGGAAGVTAGAAQPPDFAGTSGNPGPADGDAGAQVPSPLTTPSWITWLSSDLI